MPPSIQHRKCLCENKLTYTSWLCIIISWHFITLHVASRQDIKEENFSGILSALYGEQSNWKSICQGLPCFLANNFFFSSLVSGNRQFLNKKLYWGIPGHNISSGFQECITCIIFWIIKYNLPLISVSRHILVPPVNETTDEYHLFYNINPWLTYNLWKIRWSIYFKQPHSKQTSCILWEKDKIQWIRIKQDCWGQIVRL